MYGRIQQKPLSQSSQQVTCESTREEMQKYIDDESRRVNVDSAKKRAVLQHMDYEGFRQMVLGANLHTVKSKELTKFSGGLLQGSNQKTFNVLATGFKKDKEATLNTEVVERVLADKMVVGIQCNSFQEFKKRFCEFYQSPLDQQNVQKLYRLLIDQDQERLKKIFKGDFDPSYFGKICEVLQLVVEGHPSRQDILFICKLLETIAQFKNVGTFIFKVLSKSQKFRLKDLISKIEQVSEEGQGSRLRVLYQGYM